MHHAATADCDHLSHIALGCRTSPYQDVVTDGAHLERAAALVEQAYANTGLPVYLGGHSNGPLYALALLNSKSAEWRAKYIGEPNRV